MKFRLEFEFSYNFITYKFTLLLLLLALPVGPNHSLTKELRTLEDFPTLEEISNEDFQKNYALYFATSKL